MITVPPGERSRTASGSQGCGAGLSFDSAARPFPDLRGH